MATRDVEGFVEFPKRWLMRILTLAARTVSRLRLYGIDFSGAKEEALGYDDFTL
jgi:hypothetical protein